ncbi:MAG: capsule assembly Wzi family protein [Tannerellaceae bacterium]|nr:capsule assembly Wzi family protein [Tannerellaceae bacterium]
MNTKRLFFSSMLVAMMNAGVAPAQTDNEPAGWLYRTEIFASAASDRYTPFWMVSNRNGLVPLEAGNAYLSAGIFYRQQYANGIRWSGGADVAAVTPRYRNLMVRQLYTEVAYRSLLLSVGSREQHRSLWDKDLSSGDMVRSGNARPIPEIRVAMPEYTLVPRTKGWLSIKGDFSVGRSFDTGYLEQFIRDSLIYYVRDVLWHHKSAYFRIESPDGRLPLTFEIGLQHGAQWGGTSTNPRIANQPQTLSDFARVVLGMEGGKGSTASDSINVLGNHYGSYDLRLTYKGSGWTAGVYHQRYFDDKSGVIFGNAWDGLWGLQVDMPENGWLQKVVLEILETRNQTGPFHFIQFDHAKHPGVGGGGDNYYNNGEYTTGLSYLNRGAGSPLLPSPEYNTDGTVGFQNTRVHSWHAGLSGDLSPRWAYRMLATLTHSWGQPYRPFRNMKRGAYGLLEVSYRHPKLPGWLFTASAGMDRGSILGSESAGFGLRISKCGILATSPRR